MLFSKPFENGVGINSENFLDVLSSIKNLNDFVNVTKPLINDFTSGVSILNSAGYTSTK